MPANGLPMCTIIVSLNIRLNAGYPLFGDVCGCTSLLEENRRVLRIVVLLEFCLGHNPLVSGGVTVGTVSDGLFNVIVTAKVRKTGGASASAMEASYSSHRASSGSLRAQ